MFVIQLKTLHLTLSFHIWWIFLINTLICITQHPQRFPHLPRCTKQGFYEPWIDSIGLLADCPWNCWGFYDTFGSNKVAEGVPRKNLIFNSLKNKSIKNFFKISKLKNAREVEQVETNQIFSRKSHNFPEIFWHLIKCKKK